MLVVGAARGLGAAQARGFHAEGANVIIGDVHDYEGFALANELGDRALFVHLDPDCPSDWDDAIRAAQEHFGKVSMVINSAGLSDKKKV